MRRATLPILALIPFFLSASPVLAVSLPAGLYEEYQTEIGKLGGLEGEYDVAREAYLRYKTVVAETKAIDATKSYLTQNLTVLSLYWELLKNGVEQSPALLPEQRQELLSAVSEKATQAGSERGQVSSLGKLIPLSSFATEVAKEVPSLEVVAETVRVRLAIADLDEAIVQGRALADSASKEVNSLPSGEDRSAYSRRLEIALDSVTEAEEIRDKVTKEIWEGWDSRDDFGKERAIKKGWEELATAGESMTKFGADLRQVVAGLELLE